MWGRQVCLEKKDESKIRNRKLQNKEIKKMSREIIENHTSYDFIKVKSGAKECVEKSKRTKLDSGFSVYIISS
jgi:hypothetical protein